MHLIIAKFNEFYFFNILFYYFKFYFLLPALSAHTINTFLFILCKTYTILQSLCMFLFTYNLWKKLKPKTKMLKKHRDELNNLLEYQQIILISCLNKAPIFRHSDFAKSV